MQMPYTMLMTLYVCMRALLMPLFVCTCLTNALVCTMHVALLRFQWRHSGEDKASPAYKDALSALHTRRATKLLQVCYMECTDL